MKIINVQLAHISVKVVSIKLIIVYNVKLIEIITPTAIVLLAITMNNKFV